MQILHYSDTISLFTSQSPRSEFAMPDTYVVAKKFTSFFIPHTNTLGWAPLIILFYKLKNKELTHAAYHHTPYKWLHMN